MALAKTTTANVDKNNNFPVETIAFFPAQPHHQIMMIADAYLHVNQSEIRVRIELNSPEFPHDSTDDFLWKMVEELPLPEKFEVELMLNESEPKGKLFVAPIRCGYRIYRLDNSEWFKAQSLNVNPNTGKRP
jgi:hypothetical protein